MSGCRIVSKSKGSSASHSPGTLRAHSSNSDRTGMGRPVVRSLNENTASMFQVWHSDASTNTSTGRPVAKTTKKTIGTKLSHHQFEKYKSFELCEISSKTQCSNLYWTEVPILLAVGELKRSAEYRQTKDCLRKAVRKGYSSSAGYVQRISKSYWMERRHLQTPGPDCECGPTLTLTRGTSGNGRKTTGSLPFNAQGKNAPVTGRPDYSDVVKGIKDLCGNGNGVRGPHRLRLRQNGKGRKRGGTLKMGGLPMIFFFKRCAYSKWRLPCQRQRREVSTAHRTAHNLHTQTFFWRVAEGLDKGSRSHCCSVCCFSLKYHLHERTSCRKTWLDRSPFSFTTQKLLSTRPSRQDHSLRAATRYLCLAVLPNRARSQVMTNAPVEVSSTDVTTMLLASRKASIGSTYHSGEDIVTTLAVSEEYERSSFEKVLGHVHRTFLPVRAGVLFRKGKDSC